MPVITGLVTVSATYLFRLAHSISSVSFYAELQSFAVAGPCLQDLQYTRRLIFKPETNYFPTLYAGLSTVLPF